MKKILILASLFNTVVLPSSERITQQPIEPTMQIEDNVETTTNDIYAHSTYILTNNPETSFPLKPEIEKIAIAQNIALNGSKFFDTNDICDTNLTFENLRKYGAQEVPIKTEDGQTLKCTFLDRKKDKVIVVGPGFTNAKEKMSPLAHIYADYDVLIMNFRGHGHRQRTLNPLVNLLGVDGNVKLGIKEELDTYAVVNYLKNLSGKYYTEIIGHGICYGALIFAKAQGLKEENGEVLFDKLVLDGIWHSLNKFRDKVIGDPALISNPQKGGASNFAKCLFGKKWFNGFIQRAIENGLHINFNDLVASKYLQHVTIPVLFFYGKDDLTIYRNEFEEIWHATKSNHKIACITSNPHVWNHLKQKEFYKLICEIFIDTENTNKATSILNNHDELMSYLFERLNGNARELDESVFKPIKKQKTFLEQITPGKKSFYASLVLLAAAGIVTAYKNELINKEKCFEFKDYVVNYLKSFLKQS